MKRILCVSAEPSGDQLLAPIIRELVALGAQPLGVGGEHSRQAGLELICHTDELSGAGIVEALPAIPRHVRTLARLKHLIPTVDALLVVDAPELGTRLLKNAHKCGLRTAYLAPPQAWAWRPWRAKKLSNCHWVGCLFSFEAEWYRRRGVPAVCIGHPLARVTPLPPSVKEGIAILPGSRVGYVRRVLPILLKAAMRLEHPKMTFIFRLQRAVCDPCSSDREGLPTGGHPS